MYRAVKEDIILNVQSHVLVRDKFEVWEKPF
jgi:hypothetical protein